MSTSTTEAAGKAESGNVFSELLSDLGDHYGIVLSNYHVADLPMIFIDNGFHFYSSPAAMEADGKYSFYKKQVQADGTVTTEHVHHPIRTSDNGHPALDLSPTNFVFFEWMAMLLLFVAMRLVVGKYKKGERKAPSGFQNAIEALVVFIRDGVVVPNIKSASAQKRLLPYFLSLFFFIFTLNLLGLLPGGHAATGAIGVTAGLAITAFLVINYTAIRESGIGAWFHHLLGGAPWWMFMIMVPIEIIGLFSKPFALTMRLFANMTAGHVVLLSLVALIFFFETLLVSPASIAFSLFIYTLELLVAFLQAFIFTILTAVFVGLAVGEHAHEEHH